jgi:hypothetical protein
MFNDDISVIEVKLSLWKLEYAINISYDKYARLFSSGVGVPMQSRKLFNHICVALLASVLLAPL